MIGAEQPMRGAPAKGRNLEDEREDSMFSIRAAAMTLALFGAAAVAPASAQEDYPNRPVQILIPNAAGGPTDIFARIMAEGMSKILGQSFVVDPRPGASGQIAARAL